MANIKVSEMTEATSFDDGDYTMIVQANQNKKLPFEVISNIIDEKLNNYNIARYHVGAIIVDTANINPNTYLGFGTWEYFGKGRTIVGVDEEDEDFENAELTGGEKKHTLTIDEMPTHNHVISGAGNTSYATGASTNMANRGGSNPNTTNTNNTGGGQPHNIMQPYITVYFWKRVA